MDPADATGPDLLRAASAVVRENLVDRMLETRRRQRGARGIAYVSMECLIGRSFVNNLISLGLYDEVKAALAAFGASIDTLAGLEEVEARWPGDHARAARMSLIEESEPKQVRMAHLAIVGSHSVNGVAAMHSELVKHDLVPELHAMWPERFNNKTNGVTPRRWLHTANPGWRACSTTRSVPAGSATSTRSARSSRSPTTPGSATGSRASSG